MNDEESRREVVSTIEGKPKINETYGTVLYWMDKWS
jgi:hypothetical protein